MKEFLKNKKVVFYGDSLTHNWEKYDHDLNLTHGKDFNYGLGYNHVKMLNDVCHFKSVDNFAVSAGCYANISSIRPHRNEYRNFPYQIDHSLQELKDADVIFIMFGTNDYAEQVTFGDYLYEPIKSSKGDMTFYQGMNYGFSKIKEINPKAKVFVLNIMYRTVDIEPNVTYNYSTNEYNLAIAHMVKLYNYNLIDVSKLFNKDNFYKINSDDGLHLNENGYKILTDYILNYKVD